ncbi:Serine/threonine-protein kinase vrk1 [Bulinus truncatus]|nr:Serine/threonine-protein kinase vrk1 [Bulinus truncatus]
MPRASGAKKNPSSHQLPEQLPAGTLLQDLCKQEWSLGKVIGKGGFGLIYLASRRNPSLKSTPEDRVIKIEPKSNGPLYCEMQFYQRVAKPDCIQAFIEKKKLKYLGIPPFIGTGSLNASGKEYRFLVMNRFGTDLQKLLMERGGTFSPNVVFTVGLRMLDALHYCHENEYVHADIKASNILLGYHSGKDVPEVYLVDFGLAYRYTVDGVHKTYKEEPRQAHNGTIEFTSRDAHKGVAPSRRGDMEILGYCMLQWLCKKLPWEDNLNNAAYVASSKEKFMKDIPRHIKTLNSNLQSCTETVKKYFELVNTLKYDDTPNYNSFKKILLDGLTSVGQKDEWKIDFTKSLKRKSEGSEEPAAKKAKSPRKSPLTPKKKCKPQSPPANRSSVKVTSPALPKATKAKNLVSEAKQSPAAEKRSQVLASSSKTKVKSPVVEKRSQVRASSSKTNVKSPASEKRSQVHASSSKTKVKSLTPKKIKIPPPTKSPLTDSKSNRAPYFKRKRIVVSQSNASVQTSPCLKK